MSPYAQQLPLIHTDFIINKIGHSHKQKGNELMTHKHGGRLNSRAKRTELTLEVEALSTSAKITMSLAAGIRELAYGF